MVFRVLLCLAGLFLSACFDENPKSATKEASKEILEENITKKSAEEEALKNKLKEEQKAKLNRLSQELHNQNIKSSKTDSYNEGLKRHTEFFENFYNRKDLPKNPNKNNPQELIDRAYKHQEKQIESLRKNQEKRE
ncbi:hypothetical protein HEBU111660_03985 [Helicobacter burdigaliensis]